MEMELARLREEIINYRERFNNLEGVTRAPTDSGSEVQYNQAIALENHRSVQEPQEPDRAGRGATLDNSYLELISPASIDDMFTIDQFLIDLPAEDGEQGHIFSACQRAHDSCFSIGAQSLSSIYHLPRPDIGFNQHTQAGEQNPSSQDIRSLADKLVIIRVQRVTDSISRLLDCECINASDTNLLAILAATISRIPNFYQALYDFNLGNQSFSQPTTQNESRPSWNRVLIRQPPDFNALLYSSLSFGFSLIVNIWAFFGITGGLFNPAVTLGLCLIGGIPAARRRELDNQGLFIEMFLTAQLVFVVIMLAVVEPKSTFLAPVAIGFTFFVREMIGNHYTGGSLNPARTLGPDVIKRDFPVYL
ncbi:aquaporin-like protein [Aspergillus cavernicola]|uniref:Aquaporin-like protein n=1 Tax=Aspergillus cavernicola TaxID=176166 RepID=A0ABR4IK53_9EURO